jgi:class 3 adenylate cyclase/predicted ATPase
VAGRVQQIADWLAQLGLEQYAQRFAENEIDVSVLRYLTDQDLKEIGIPLGPRRKILAATAEAIGGAEAAAKSDLEAKSKARGTATPPRETTVDQRLPSSPSIDAHAGERRYLTVMFCDIVGSTGIAAKLDAEEWRDLVSAYLDSATQSVTEMGGHVAKKLGDGLLALFGYPVAQENDAERAARAALSIQRALTDLNRKNTVAGKAELAARIGLDTGPAVVDAAGEIYGDVANIAARVQALAEPGTVLITARVQRQVAGLFVAEERGSHTLKGVPEPTALYRLIRASGGGRRSAQRRLTPLVGREEEIALLMRRWERVRQGDGQMVLVSGEPGIGKSRLIEEFHARLRDTPHTWAEWTCSQLLQNTPFHPIAEWGRQRFGGADVAAEQRLADLESSLAQVKLDPDEYAPLLAPMLDIPLTKERVPALAAEELRRRQLAAATTWAIAGARIQPVVLALEDAHWADPTTLDVLRGIAERGALAPMFVLITTRPEFKPPWGMRSHHSTVSLAPLDRAQVQHIVSELAARHALPKDVVDGVAERTGGVPLFVEEVTRLLLERGEQGGIQAIPPTLQQSLTARLDRLGPAREVAQIGSVIGRDFSYGLLRAVAGMADGPLQAVLEKLAEADIVLVQGLPPDSDYRFKHALIQDAAHENLLKSRRQALHRRVAETLRERFANTAAAEPEVLAHHFTQARMTDAAIEWWGKAGDQALRRSAFQEAISHLGKAIEMADKEDEVAPHKVTAATAVSERLKLQTNYGRALAWSRGFAADETKAAYARAHELSEGADVSNERFDALYGQWVVSAIGGELRVAREIAETFRREAQKTGRKTEGAVGLRYLGLTCLMQGEFDEAEAYLVQALELYHPERDREANLRYGVDTGAAALIYLAEVKWYLGNLAQVREFIEEAVARALASGHVPTMVGVYQFKAILESLREDVLATRGTAETLRELGQRHKLAAYIALGEIYSGWARAKLGEREAGIAELQRGLTAYTELGTKGGVPYLQGLLAEIEADGQQVEASLVRVDEALASAANRGEHWTDALLHRIRGEILLKRDPANAAAAEEAFLTAIAIAQQQKAKSFELRAALSLGKLYQSTNRAVDAHSVLALAPEGFSPTPEFPEIEEAQGLLAALAETDDVKNAAAARRRRLDLQTSYGRALAWSRGFGTEEAKSAFARARELAAGVDVAERFATYYGWWVGSLNRGELASARDAAETFWRDAKERSLLGEAASGLRFLSLTCLLQGDLIDAQAHLEEALRLYDPERDREAKFRFGTDAGASSPIYLAWTTWLLGDIVRSRELSEDAIARAAESSHVPTILNAHYFKTNFEIIRGDFEAARLDAQFVARLSREHGAVLYQTGAAMCGACARAQLGELEAGTADLKQALAAHADGGVRALVPFYTGLLARLEAEGNDVEAALTRVEAALALANETTERWSDAVLHRIRGEILLKRDPANPAPPEEAFLTAIAVAQQQKARSFELRAASSLAKLYRSTGRAADAQAVLAPSLERFSPTLEFPEIEEAQALLAALS